MMKPTDVANALEEYQKWRRGEGKYAWNPDDENSVHEPCPYTPEELGKIEDFAIAYLRRLNEVVEKLRNAVSEIEVACANPFGKDARAARRIARKALGKAN